ncbi:unnamed protein product [Pieris macdunnoughi]|uniref:Uncharacterized protein n=1 Tax=Pieris macdunnoughi TaxID=345717 RepID=A0A821NW06_9NEOP|nr:unnamed protein product [Pieris macdunnoughi]
MDRDSEMLFTNKEELVNTASIHYYWDLVINKYAILFFQYIISIIYTIYTQLSLFNTAVFFFKFAPTGIFMHRYIKQINRKSQEISRQQQNEIEDIQLQIQIVNTKMSIQETEYAERIEELNKSTSRLRKGRAQVRSLIQSDDEIRHTINTGNIMEYDSEITAQCSAVDCESLLKMLKGLESDQIVECEKLKPGDSSDDLATQENSIYSTISESESTQDCTIKIVKVTNVYKVAYLKHYIKQTRLRRANRIAILKKKIDNVKKLLEDWQTSLNMVINSKLTLLSMNQQCFMTPQEAMGDGSQANYRDFSESDSDFRNSNNNDNGPDEYSLSWAHNAYLHQRSMSRCDYDDYETAISKESYEQEDLNEKYPQMMTESKLTAPGYLVALLEETPSQMAIEEIRSEASEDGDCRDLVAM